MKASETLLLALALSSFTPAQAALLEFDCDVPANHFSSISQDILNYGRINGTIRVDEMRKGNNLPVAGAGIFGPDRHAFASFQLVAMNNRSKSFDIIFNTYDTGEYNHKKVGEIDATSAIAFDISLAADGKAVLVMNGKRFEAYASPISGGRAMAFCSTAQFKFTNLAFSSDSGVSEH